MAALLCALVRLGLDDLARLFRNAQQHLGNAPVDLGHLPDAVTYPLALDRECVSESRPLTAPHYHVSKPRLNVSSDQVTAGGVL